MVYETNSCEETFALGETLGKSAQKGDVFTLRGDLGAGKTALAQGIAAGLGVSEAVCSPTYTVVSEYEGRLPLFHFDLYRLGSAEELYEIGFEDYIYGEGVCVIEWPELAEELLSEGVVGITIEKDLHKGHDYRKITVLTGRQT